MNRLIKFRAWDNEKKRMWWNVQNAYDTLGVHCCPKETDECRHDDFMPSSFGDVLEPEWDDSIRYQVMQYTGLTNNGQEWYEGDILENDADWYRVAWDTDQARWEAVGIKGTHETLALSELVSSETWVQGNVHENPELLEN